MGSWQRLAFANSRKSDAEVEILFGGRTINAVAYAALF
jgi:hypothetical protein